ncbi:MAG TPA: hypothetical protein VFZ25_03540 [Chloroflexota bacterium]|nr:hypothetical protein [Chloroflexota bacterium]
MATVVLNDLGSDAVPISAARPLPALTWTARDVDAEQRCEREVAKALSWRMRLLGWLIEYNKY